MILVFLKLHYTLGTDHVIFRTTGNSPYKHDPTENNAIDGDFVYQFMELSKHEQLNILRKVSNGENDHEYFVKEISVLLTCLNHACMFS